MKIRCTKCKEWKDPEDFGKRAAKKNGRESQCRECKKGSKRIRSYANGKLQSPIGRSAMLLKIIKIHENNLRNGTEHTLVIPVPKEKRVRHGMMMLPEEA